MVRPTDKWTKGDVIHYFWITGALLLVIIFLNTTHVLISKNSDFCEAEENVDDFLERNNVLLGIPESTLSFTGDDFPATSGDIEDTTDESIKVANSTMLIPSSGKNITSGKSQEIQTND